MIINGVSFRHYILDPTVDDIFPVYKQGATVMDIKKLTGADIASNFNYADTEIGAPIGRIIVGGKVVVEDISKTKARDELYMMPDKSLHIGKAPSGALWAVQGSPPLLRNGEVVVDEGVVRDKLGKDIWTRDAIRTAVGITADGKLIIVRTVNAVSLKNLALAMRELGCVNALNGDGGGSSYVYPYDTGWGRKLGSAIIARKGKTRMKLIALDDGHGMETPGKRTPDGSMRENEFNRAVVAKLKGHLERCGFRTLLTAPGDDDVPLKTRTDKANAANADLFLSVHANAVGLGEWNSTRGIETFHYANAQESKRIATIIHRHLIGGTRLPDRGVKTANFYVLRETRMPAVLVECAFMTNKEDAALLKSDSYRNECAEELARAVCEAFGVPYVLEEKPLPKIQRTVSGKLNGVPVDIESYLINDLTYVPLRWLAEAMGAEVEWDGQKYEYNIRKEK